MSEEYRFFDSIDGEDERFYTADEFAEYFRQFIRNGIFNGGENLKVVTDEKDMKISIKPGYAWIEGYLYKIAGEDLILEHGIADPSLNRIDRVVIRLDKTLENRYVKAFILEGTPESTPKAPSLTRNDNVYEISLAQVEIIAGKSFIESYQITDERLDNTVCGITTHLFEQVDTTDIFNEWQKYLIHKRNESDASYEEFVTAYQNIWNSWIEDKISEPSGEFYAEWKYWFNEVQDTTNLVTKSQFDSHRRRHESDGVDELSLENLKGESAELKSHKIKIAGLTELGHVRVDGETITSNNGTLSVINSDAKSIKGIEVDSLSEILDGDALVYDASLGKFVEESQRPIWIYRDGAEDYSPWESGGGSVEIQSDRLRLFTATSSSTASVVTIYPISLSGINRIGFEWSSSGVATYFTANITSDKSVSWGTYDARYLTSLSKSVSKTTNYVDVSGLNGFYYIKFFRYLSSTTTGDSGFSYIYKVWGEK